MPLVSFEILNFVQVNNSQKEKSTILVDPNHLCYRTNKCSYLTIQVDLVYCKRGEEDELKVRNTHIYLYSTHTASQI